MGKISVITLHTVSNYGSCLQTYATQNVFEKLGWNTEIVDYYRKDNLPENAVEKAFNGRRMQKYRGLFERAPWLKTAASIPMKRIVQRQRRPFDAFRESYLHLTDKMYRSYEDLKNDVPQADVYCTGSDQVWNSIWNNGFEEAYYLTYAPEEKPRIAFAASIGRESLDQWEREPMRNALSRYSHISLREQSGVRLLEELGIPGARWVLDPTLMLTGKDWREISSVPKAVKGNAGEYILLYQLNKDPKMSQYALAMGKRLNLPVVKISYGLYDILNGAKTLVAPSVNDFIGLFLNAAYVVTDSFHATAFALNFEKDFVSIAPERFSTRITSILNLTGTENRLLDSYANGGLIEEGIDWASVKQALDTARDDTWEFLKDALGDGEANVV